MTYKTNIYIYFERGAVVTGVRCARVYFLDRVGMSNFMLLDCMVIAQN